MKKRILCFAFALCLCLALAGCAQNGNLPYSSTVPSVSGLAGEGEGLSLAGQGTALSPYLVTSAADLKALSTATNGGNTFLGVCFRLTADIDLGGSTFTPIGAIYGKASPKGQGFCGSFDGAGYSISNFKVTTPKGVGYNAFPCGGLFGYIGEGGTVQQLSVSGATVTVNSSYTAFGGALAGINEGTVKNCAAYGNTITVKSTKSHACGGGLVGHNYGSLEKSVVTGAVSVTASLKDYRATVGGAVGQNNGEIKDILAACSLSATVSASDAIKGDAIGGGAVGYNCGTAENLYIGEHTFFGGIGTVATVAQMQSSSFYSFLASDVWSHTANYFPTLKQTSVAPTAVPTALESGSLGKPIAVSSASALKAMEAGKSYYLSKNVSLSGTFTPLAVFYGTFDGRGYSISGLSVNSGLGYVGLFATNCGTVKNLVVSSATVKATGANGAYGAIIAGESYGVISSCQVSGSMTNTAKFQNVAGGICGINRGGQVLDCSSSVTVSSTGTVLGVYGGGLVGHNEGIVARSYASGSVTTVSTLQYPTSGGLVGVNDGTISDSYATGSAAATSWGELARAGGLAGVNSGVIKNCYATGAAEAVTYNGAAHAGSLVGDNHAGKVQSSFGCGNVSVTSAVSSGMLAGPLVGGDESRTGVVADSFYLQTLVVTRMADTETSATTTPANTAGQARASGSFTQALLGWSSDVWQFGATYPTLK
ncbi:MAG: hypothetical protein J6V82_03950 [Clostridia bacterium]|nr:hypothetical protein [Clostridia bacterium]